MRDRNAWTHLHHLAYLCAGVASNGDQKISRAELEVMSKKLHEWNEDMGVPDLLEIVVEATDAFTNDSSQPLSLQDDIVASAEFLRGELGDESLLAAMQDLVAIAEADGALLPEELEILLVIRATWCDELGRAGGDDEDSGDGVGDGDEGLAVDVDSVLDRMRSGELDATAEGFSQGISDQVEGVVSELKDGASGAPESRTLSADWTSIVEDCAWPLAREVAVRCYEEKPVEPGSSKRFSGVRKHYRDCDWINVIFRQKYLSLYIKGEERDWEGLFAAIGVQPEIRRWRDGVQVRCRTSEEVLAAMNWLELPLSS